jgi:hypothetical protein
MEKKINEFFVPTITQFFQLFSKFYPQLPRQSPPSGDAVDPEGSAQATGLVVGQGNMDWTKIMVAFCLASAIDIALLSVQVHSQLPPAFHLLSLVILLAFASFFVSKFINSKFVVTAQVLQKFGVLFTVTAFFMAITIPSPFYLKLTGLAVYIISLLAILISSCF